MKRIVVVTFVTGLLLGLGACASKPVREYDETTKRVISEQPVIGR